MKRFRLQVRRRAFPIIAGCSIFLVFLAATIHGKPTAVNSAARIRKTTDQISGVGCDQCGGASNVGGNSPNQKLVAPVLISANNNTNVNNVPLAQNVTAAANSGDVNLSSLATTKWMQIPLLNRMAITP